MSKNEQLIDLLSESFKTSNFLKWGPAEKPFRCKHKLECQVNEDKQPILSPFFGSRDCDVMVVAEKPSGAGGTGPRIGGLFAELPKEELGDDNPIFCFREFAQNYCRGVTPYMTDLAKCGLVGNQPTGEVLDIRYKNCFGRFLVREIEYIEPKTILCVGGIAYRHLVKHQKRGDIDGEIKLVYLAHYSRQASLPLDPKDKLNIIWSWQADPGAREKIKAMKLSELSYFQKKPKPDEGY